MANGKYININYPNIYIYALVSEEDQKNIKYIGVTSKTPSNRLSNHIYEAKKTPNKTDKTKWITSVNYKLKQIILDIVDFETAYFWEQYWISQFKTWGFVLVNSNNGGGGLGKRSIEFSAWLSNRNKGNKYNLGKTHSEDTKLKMSNKKLGKPSPRKGIEVLEKTKEKQSKAKIGSVGNATGFKHTEETKNKKRKKVLQISINGQIINEFTSVSDVSNYFSVNISTISKRLDKNKEYKGFIFKTKIENNG
jgi:group I intron endonuclease